MVPESKGVVYRNTFFLYLMTAVKFVLPVIITAVLARRLSPSGYGVIAFETAVMNYFVLLFDYGFNYSATKKISIHRDDRQYVQQVVGRVMTAKILLVAFGLSAMLVLFLFVPMLREYWALSVAYYLSTAVNVFLPDFAYRGFEEMGQITIRYTIGRFVALTMVCLTVWSISDLILVPVAYAVGTALASLYAFWNLYKKKKIRLSFASISSSISMLREGFVYFLSLITTTALTAFNALVMGALGVDPTLIADWTIALQLVAALQALNDPITSSLFPHVAKSGDYGFVLKLLIPVCLLVFVLVGVSYCLSDQLVYLLAGPGYEEASEVFRILVVLVAFSFPAQIIGFPLLGALGHQNEVTISTCLSALFHTVVTLSLIPLGVFNLVVLSYVRVASELVLLLARAFFVARFVAKSRKALP